VRVELKGRSGSLPRIAFLSDLHAGFFNTSGDLENIARMAAESNPDLVILGGDLIDSHGEEIFLLGAALKRLNPPLGIFAVRGNHEYFHPEEMELWTRFLEHNGVEVLVNRAFGSRGSMTCARVRRTLKQRWRAVGRVS
jgi:predicted MPP superfamily phosphohydrolase